MKIDLEPMVADWPEVSGRFPKKEKHPTSHDRTKAKTEWIEAQNGVELVLHNPNRIGCTFAADF